MIRKKEAGSDFLLLGISLCIVAAIVLIGSLIESKSLQESYVIKENTPPISLEIVRHSSVRHSSVRHPTEQLPEPMQQVYLLLLPEAHYHSLEASDIESDSGQNHADSSVIESKVTSFTTR